MPLWREFRLQPACKVRVRDVEPARVAEPASAEGISRGLSLWRRKSKVACLDARRVDAGLLERAERGWELDVDPGAVASELEQLEEGRPRDARQDDGRRGHGQDVMKWSEESDLLIGLRQARSGGRSKEGSRRLDERGAGRGARAPAVLAARRPAVRTTPWKWAALEAKTVAEERRHDAEGEGGRAGCVEIVR
jgi:hypothetical protein